MERRNFLQSSSLGLSTVLLATSSARTQSDSDRKVTLGIMGCSRGLGLFEDLCQIPNVEIKFLCDCDKTRLISAMKTAEKSDQKPSAVSDFRHILDDESVDALVCAAPNHWHGPATIMACKTGKHVYVEKPASHNPQEGLWMIEAAMKFGKCVQVGTQRRSSPGYLAAIQKLHSGAIGNVFQARCFFHRLRGSIGTTKPTEPPNDLDYSLWQGPAPKRPFKSNVVHYNWHWFWHWGNGELGNNGIHGLDICRWGLGVEYPIRTVSSGGRYGFSDDQETPDTHSVCWEFEGNKQITYQGISTSQHPPGPFVSFYGSEGYLEIDTEGVYVLYDRAGKVIEKSSPSTSGQREHLTNFLEAVRADDPSLLAQPIRSGHISTHLCHLGNVAHRVGGVVSTNGSDGKWTDASIPSEYWQRAYETQWESAVVP